VEYRVTAHPEVTGEDICGNVILAVADRQPLSRGIGEEVEDVGLAPLARIRSAVRPLLLPDPAPALLDGAKVVL
jgi:hypothetical protein